MKLKEKITETNTHAWLNEYTFIRAGPNGFLQLGRIFPEVGVASGALIDPCYCPAVMTLRGTAHDIA
jgi:hypothetical protein